ncbi:MAG: hypothetical protein A2Z83_01305 [Omnitrophica bacterium GWA2_52_8]|nr:MAG: hypothetical protein A2Z83_01305 [Omnitrophica bacterium GWA2_52_8]
MKIGLRVPNKIVIASPLVLFAGAAISGFEIASSASPPRKDKTKGVLLGASKSKRYKEVEKFLFCESFI